MENKVCGTCRHGVEIEPTYGDFNSLECGLTESQCGDIWRTTCDKWQQG